MISGIPSSGGFFSQPRINQSKGAPRTPPPPEESAIPDEAEPAALSTPTGDKESLTREFNLFDVATRQFEQILPRLELATLPLD